MTRDKILELADMLLGAGKYNPGRVIAFAQACEREGFQTAARMMRAIKPDAVQSGAVPGEEPS